MDFDQTLETMLRLLYQKAALLTSWAARLQFCGVFLEHRRHCRYWPVACQK